MGQGARVRLICARTDCLELMQTFSMEDLYFWIRRLFCMMIYSFTGSSSSFVLIYIRRTCTKAAHFLPGKLACVQLMTFQILVHVLIKLCRRI
ncbi:hypothetical protein NC651_034062 [Populus alba x Populus x berolinensis]|nr:hypothetical protein NC651_034062 [Populus alba x Populus x berolinensis]